VSGLVDDALKKLAAEMPENAAEYMSDVLYQRSLEKAADDKGRDKARLNTGTGHTLADTGKIGPEFTRSENPEYHQSREAVFARIAEQQAARIAAQPREAIAITIIGLPQPVMMDGTSYETKPIDVAKFVSKELAKEALVAEVVYTSPRCGVCEIAKTDDVEEEDDDDVEGELWDMLRPLEASCNIKLLTFDDKAGKMVFWHSSAHILGEALECGFGCALCIGPPLKLTPKGSFYYDAYMGKEVVSDKEFKGIEARAKKISKQSQKFERLVLTKEEALELFADNVFKHRIIQTKVPDGSMTTVYKCGPLIDLCLGPHIPDTSRVKSFKLCSASTSFFAGNIENDALQRVYGASFPSTDQMKDWQEQCTLVEKYDHRKIGMEQELFFFHRLSPGSAMFLPHGTRVYNKLMDFIRKQYWERGYDEVITPNIYNTKLWETSGHWQHYKENMFSFRDADMQRFALKPMNCPGHCLMFDHRVRSYRDLPLRMADFGVLHRNEESGALTGLTRVRRFQQDDAHIFCREDQIRQEVEGALDFMQTIYGIFGMTFKLDLSTRPKKACGLETPEGVAKWDKAEAALAEALDNFIGPGKWRVNEGDGAFYGPKIDIKVFDVMKREHQCATIQLDFQLPLRFKLQYKTADNTVQTDPDLPAGFARPVMVHRAMLGSVERMMAVLIEHFRGRWPFWLSPRQAQVVPVHPDHNPYALEVAQFFTDAGFYVDADVGADTMGAKIRNATKSEYNFVLVVGPQEVEERGVTIRTRVQGDNEWAKGFLSLDACLAFFTEIVNTYAKTPEAVEGAAPEAKGKAGKQAQKPKKEAPKKEAPKKEAPKKEAPKKEAEFDLEAQRAAARKNAAEFAANLTPEEAAIYGAKIQVAASGVRPDSDGEDDGGADFAVGGADDCVLLGDY